MFWYTRVHLSVPANQVVEAEEEEEVLAAMPVTTEANIDVCAQVVALIQILELTAEAHIQAEVQRETTEVREQVKI